MLILKYIANVNLICTSILDAIVFDPKISSFSSVGATTYPHKGAACALFYSPKHKNRPAAFIGGSNDTSFDNRAEVLDYTVKSTWEKRMYTNYQIQAIVLLHFSENQIREFKIIS